MIGICCRRDLDSDRFYMRRQYSEAVFNAGGIPVLLPLIPDQGGVTGLMKKLDGIILAGSHSDVDPFLYNQGPHTRLGSVLPERDCLDLLLLKECFAQKVPLLAICYGIQILNVFLGGSLWQDLESQMKNPLKHSQQAPPDYQSHSLRIQTGTLLHQLAGKTEIRVNSFHHQGIRQLAPSLRAVAISPDRLVEAVELKQNRGKSFLLGIQWHPEIGWEKDELSRKIFARFVLAAGQRS
jgi:putative glutamine amidotransferase